MAKFMLDKITFENYKIFEEEQTLDFTTNKKFQNDPSVEKIKWKNSKGVTTKYKNILGIWGKNSAGKTSILEIINIWKKLWKISQEKFLGIDTIPISRRLKNNYREHKSFFLNNMEMDEYTFFNNPKKPFKISLFFSIDDFEFIHSFKLKNEKIINENKNLQESITIIKNAKKKEFDADSINLFLYNSILIKSKNMIKKYIKENKDKKEIIKEIEKIYDSTQKKAEDIQLEFIYSILEDFYSQISIWSPIKKNPYHNHGMGDIDKVNFFLSSLYKIKKINKHELKNLLLTTIQTVDNNIKNIELDFDENVRNKAAAFKSIITKNGVKNFPDELSLGTINFVTIILKIINTINLESKNKQYIFVDELGLNWHSNLTKEFLFKFIEKSSEYNIVLIFTSHDSYIMDYLNPDSIYFINNESNLVKASDFTNKNGNSIRKNENISNSYLNDSLDIFSTNPSFDNLYELESLIEKYTKNE